MDKCDPRFSWSTAHDPSTGDGWLASGDFPRISQAFPDDSQPVESSMSTPSLMPPPSRRPAAVSETSASILPNRLSKSTALLVPMNPSPLRSIAQSTLMPPPTLPTQNQVTVMDDLQDSQLASIRRDERRTEIEIINRAVQNVYSIGPEMAGKLGDARSRTETEMTELNEALNFNNKILHDESKELRELNYNLSVLKKDLMTVQFETLHKERSCSLTQEEIDGLLVEAGSLRLDLVRINSDRENRLLKNKNCRGKMSGHCTLVNEREARSEANVCLLQIQKEICKLRNEMTSLGDMTELVKLRDGSVESRLKEEIEGLMRYQTIMEKQVEEAQNQLEVERTNVQQSELDCDVLKKRNAAQLKRLEKQVKDLQSRDKYWTEQCSQIEHSIESVTQHLQQQ